MSPADKGSGVYLFFGEDNLRMEIAANKLVEKTVPPEDVAFRLDTVDARVDTVENAAQALRQCVQGLLTVGLLGNDKVVWLRNANFFPPAVLARSELVKTRIEELVQILQKGLPPGLILLVTASKLAKNTRLYKACRANGIIREFAAAGTTSKADITRNKETASNMFRHQGLDASPTTIELFVNRVGSDTRQMYMEVCKLATFLGDRKEVQPDDIHEIVCMAREGAAWEFSNAVAERDIRRALTILQQTQAQKDLPPIRLIYNLEYRIRDLLVFCESIERGWLRISGSREWPRLSWQVPPEGEQLLAKLGVKDPRKAQGMAAKTAGQAEGFTRAELECWHERVLQAHERFVQTSLPPLLVLELLVFELLGRRRPEPNP